MAVRRTKFHQLTLRALGGVGYFTLFMEWFWLVALYLPAMFESELGKTIFPAGEVPEPQPVPSPTASVEPSALLVVLTVVLAVCLLAAVTYIIFMKYIPAAAKVSNKAVHIAAEKTVPLVAHRQAHKISAKKQRLLTARMVFWLKIIFTTVPPLWVYGVRHTEDTIAGQLIVLGFACMAALALGSFMLQAVAMKRWRMKEADA